MQRDSARLRESAARLAEVVEANLASAMHALLKGDDALANVTALRDKRANRMLREITQDCHAFIARHLPSGGHLRLVSSILRLATELERIGDYSVTISREAVHLSHPPQGIIRRELEAMAADALQMLRQAMQSFNQGNAELARGTKAMADQVGRRLAVAVADLVSQADTGKETVKDLLDLFVIFQMLERVSDRAKNLCEETLFATVGETKPLKIYQVLFVDTENRLASQMAEFIGMKTYGDTARFSSGGSHPAAAIDPRLAQFMQRHGHDLGDAAPKRIELNDDIEEVTDVIISLEGPVRQHVSSIPFHAAFLAWDLEPLPELPGEADKWRPYEHLYRCISVRIRDLMDLLRGEGDGSP
ncbi:MAG: phosphate signaling complex protein PhoU [Candidatus Schekmanbacteria bacterium]|nr:phosphate signaling complex protein PhoU [Candidatus Schekmanbacteria bacterium]